MWYYIDLIKFSNIFLLFFIYSVIGYICEIVYCFILNNGKFQNRGFLYGPYCPIYGCGALLILFILNRYDDSPLLLFLMAAITSSVLEYSTSFLMEKLFNNKWWDYSNQKFNINGRICLKYSLMFGAMGIILTYFINPFVLGFLNNIPNLYKIIIAIIFAVLMIIDTILSSNVAFKLKQKLKNIQSEVNGYMETEYAKIKQRQQENIQKISTMLKEKTVKLFDDKKSKSAKKLLFKLPEINNKNIDIIKIVKDELSKTKNKIKK